MKLELLCEIKACFQAQSLSCSEGSCRKDCVVISAEPAVMVMNEQTADQWAAPYSNLAQS